MAKILMSNAKIVNFDNKQMHENDDKNTPLTMGLVLTNILLKTELDPADDPIEIYELSKKIWNNSKLELSDKQVALIQKYVKMDKSYNTICKGQVLQTIRDLKPTKS